MLVGAIGYGYGMRGGNASITALIPARFGVVFIVLGLAGGRSEHARKHLMHAAVALALLGFLLTAGRVLMRISSIELNAAVISQLTMALVCLMLVLAGVRSFSAARRARTVDVID